MKSKLEEAYDSAVEAGKSLAKQLFKAEQDRDALAAELKALRKQEPAAWVTPARYGSAVAFPKKNKPADWNEEMGDWYCTPLYARPVPARELKNDDLVDLYVKHIGPAYSMQMMHHEFARAIQLHLKGKLK